jgi:hypothetical protein
LRAIGCISCVRIGSLMSWVGSKWFCGHWELRFILLSWRW